jgi:pyridoxamine 5'-phosphate oxidase
VSGAAAHSGSPATGDPLARVAEWYGEAVSAGLPEPGAMALATASADGVPSVRFVLLKGVDARGVEFFTNYESRKGRELAENPRGALALFWQPLARQIRLEGRVEVLSEAESDAYFATRARGSRIGAWASLQSRPIPDRAWLDARGAEAEARFPGEDVPRPPYWGGYLLVPHAIEFWSGRPDRLHDRALFTRGPDGTWVEQRLSP